MVLGGLGGTALAAAVAACGSTAVPTTGPTTGPTPGGPDLTQPFDPALVPDVRPGPVETGTFVSADRLGLSVPWSIIRPPHVHGPLPVVVALHGHGGSTAQLVSQWGVPQFLAAAVAAGTPPFAIATVNGGVSFWHPRPWGEDAGAMVIDELLPLVARHGLPTRRIGLLGWSMGGYGALRLAGLLGADRVAAVCAGSPGLYTDPAQAHPDGFVDAAEYERFSIMDDQRQLAGIPVRVDVGTEDPFYAAVRSYLDGFPPTADLTVTTAAAGHEVDFSLGMLASDLAWLGARVAHLT